MTNKELSLEVKEHFELLFIDKTEKYYKQETKTHQEKSICLARSGTSGTSVSGRFSCQKSLSSHFFSEILYNHNYIKIFRIFIINS